MIKNESKTNIDFKFIHGDFTVMEWSDANIIFANSTCFDEPMMKKITKLVENTRSGTFIMTTTTRYNIVISFMAAAVHADV